MKTHNSTRVATKHSSNSLDASRFMIPCLGQFQHLKVREQSHPQNKEGKCNVALYLRGTWCISLEKKESQKTRSEGNKKKLPCQRELIYTYVGEVYSKYRHHVTKSTYSSIGSVTIYIFQFSVLSTMQCNFWPKWCNAISDTKFRY